MNCDWHFLLLVVEGGDSSERRYEERRLRAQAQRCEQGVAGGCLNFCKKRAEIRQIELFVVRLAEAMPAESVRLERKATVRFFSLFYLDVYFLSKPKYRVP
ncbi:hypothetical protein [Sporosarcina luteola]|uniref:hypothetical protein n=1 Tax=Sporosarcina luteola TaxID=582850 RepID=UPI0011BD5210|nr:hypothetical protein [Sporosarcina luteola]